MTDDTERLRRIVLQHVAQPKRTILHGQSWGAMVATRAAEMFGIDAARHGMNTRVAVALGLEQAVPAGEHQVGARHHRPVLADQAGGAGAHHHREVVLHQPRQVRRVVGEHRVGAAVSGPLEQADRVRCGGGGWLRAA